MATPDPKSWSAWPRRAALLVAALTLPLIFMGGRVTSTGSGMAVYDWPTTFGWNLFTFPIERWTGPIGIEHSHRVMGGIVGIATILLALAFGFLDPRRPVKALGFAALVLVSIQGTLGGLRVVLYEHGLAPVHGCVAQAFFAFIAALAVITSRSWGEARAVATEDAAAIRRLSLALVGVAYLQVIFGAWYRHTWGARLEPHALGAVGLVALAVVLGRRIKRAHADQPWLARAPRHLHAALGIQVLLGLASWLVKPSSAAPGTKVAIVSFHLVGGALVLGACVALALKVHRSLAPSAAPVRELEAVA